MKITDECSWLTFTWFMFAIIFGTLYFVEKADNHDLEQRYYQCSDKYY